LSKYCYDLRLRFVLLLNVCQFWILSEVLNDVQNHQRAF
jgi:hypothetical protein